MNSLQFDVLTPERIKTPPADGETHPHVDSASQASTPEPAHKESSIFDVQTLSAETSDHDRSDIQSSGAMSGSDDANIVPIDEDSPLLRAILQYGDLEPLDILTFTHVCRASRHIATSDYIIEPLLARLGLRRTSVAEETHDDGALLNLSDEISPLNILDRGYGGPAYAYLERIFITLSPFAKRPDLIASRFAHSTADQVKVLNNAKALATLIRQSAWLDALALQQHKKSLQLLDGVRRALEIGDSSELGRLTKSLESLGFQGEDLAELVVESNPPLATSIINFDEESVDHPEPAEGEENSSLPKSDEDQESSVLAYLETLEAALARLSAGIGRAKANVSSLPLAWRKAVAGKVSNVITLRLNEFFNHSLIGFNVDSSDESSIDETPSENDVTKCFKTLIALREWLDREEKEGLDSTIIEGVRSQVFTRLQEHFLTVQSLHLSEFGREKMAAWVDKVADIEHEKESFIWSSLPRSSEKKSFLTSFMWSFGATKDEEPVTPKLPTVESFDSSVGSVHSIKRRGSSFTTTPRSVSGTILPPQNKLEAQTAVLITKLQNIETLVSMPLVLDLIETGRKAVNQAREVGATSAYQEKLFVALLDLIGRQHIQPAFDRAISTLNDYDPKRYGRLIVQDVEDGSSVAVEPLAIFAELVNVADLVQQLIHVFFEKELVANKIVKKTDFAKPSVKAKRRFEQVLDDRLAEGLSRGIDVLMDQVEFILKTEQLGSDFCPIPGMGPPSLGPTAAAEKVVDLVRSHLNLLSDSTEKNLFDVFQQEVGLRLYHAITRHIKSQTINLDGAVTLLGDINFYYQFAASLKRGPLTAYYEALKQIGQLYLIDTADARQLGVAAADISRFKGVMSSEELVEFLRRRQDWPLVRGKVEGVLYGMTECLVM